MALMTVAVLELASALKPGYIRSARFLQRPDRAVAGSRERYRGREVLVAARHVTSSVSLRVVNLVESSP